MKFIKYISFGTLALLTLMMVAATIIEKFYGADFAANHIYRSPVAIVLWAIAAATGLFYIISRRKTISFATFTLHLSFVIIIAGAATTFFTSQSGKLKLGILQTEDSFILGDGEVAPLPFSIRLDSCFVEKHTGTMAAKDYVSVVTIYDNYGSSTHRISMNKILDSHNYRFYQTAMGNGYSVLSVSYDPAGIGLTYAGYLLLAVSMIAFFFSRKSRFHTLISKKTIILLLALITAGGASAAIDMQPRSIPAPLAKHFGTLPVYWGDRIMPLQTMARDFCLQTYGSESFHGLSAEQVLTGWLFYYDDWKKIPFIKVKGENTASALGSTEKFIPLTGFYSPQGYLLKDALSENISDKGLQETDDRVGLVTSICTGAAIRLFPMTDSEGSTRWLSLADQAPADMASDQYIFVSTWFDRLSREIQTRQWKNADDLLDELRRYQILHSPAGSIPGQTEIKTEIGYNNISGTLIPAIILILISFFATLYHGNKRYVDIILTAVSVLFFLWISIIIGIRWHIGRHFPITNGYETMLSISWISLASGIAISCIRNLRQKFFNLLPLTASVAGLSMLVAHISRDSGAVGPMMPVLSSPLLSIHVLLIMWSYAIFAIIALNALKGCAKRENAVLSKSVADTNVTLLYPALFMLTAGIFIGAVWANQSWGRYWGWDPKETWALITMIIYAFPVHSASFRWFRNPYHINLYLALAFLSVLMTYFGVNYLLSGLHSYA